MKRCLMCLLLAGAVYSLAAQSNQTVSVYLPSVTGNGIDQRDNVFFYMIVYRELWSQSYITIGTDNTADFTLSGALLPIGMDAASSFVEYSFSLNLRYNRTGQIMSEQRYRYSSLDNAELAVQLMCNNVLALIRSVESFQPGPPPVQSAPQPVQPAPQPVQPTPRTVYPAPQTVQPAPQPVYPAPQPVQPAPQPVYPAPQPVQPVQPVQQPVEPVQQPVQPIQQPVEPVQQPVQPAPQPVEPVQQPVQQPVQPVTPEYREDWRERWVFFGLSAFWSPRIYIGDGQFPNLGSFGLGFYSEFQVLESVSLEIGLGMVQDKVKIIDPELILTDPDYFGKDYQDLVLEVPVLVKIALKPGGHYMLEPYSGVSFNASLVNVVKPSMISWIAGYQHGVKAGSGAFLFDFRFSMDLNKSRLVEMPDIVFKRYSLSFGIGYKYGVVPKKKN